MVSGGFGFTELMDKAGVERRLYTAGENKAFLDPFSPEEPGEVGIQVRLGPVTALATIRDPRPRPGGSVMVEVQIPCFGSPVSPTLSHFWPKEQPRLFAKSLQSR